MAEEARGQNSNIKTAAKEVVLDPQPDGEAAPRSTASDKGTDGLASAGRQESESKAQTSAGVTCLSMQAAHEECVSSELRGV